MCVIHALLHIVYVRNICYYNINKLSYLNEVKEHERRKNYNKNQKRLQRI